MNEDCLARESRTCEKRRKSYLFHISREKKKKKGESSLEAEGKINGYDGSGKLREPISLIFENLYMEGTAGGWKTKSEKKVRSSGACRN